MADTLKVVRVFLASPGDLASELPLVRAVLAKGFVGYSKYPMEFLGKHGSWSDVELIVSAAARQFRGLSILSDEDDNAYDAAARAIYALGRNKTRDILTLDAPTKLRQRLIEWCPNSQFARLSNMSLRSLLHSNIDSERRIAVLKCLRALPRKRIVELMDQYMASEHRYYNVVYWLDFGLSVPRTRMLALVSEELDGA